jgi:hypothetical protein
VVDENHGCGGNSSIDLARDAGAERALAVEQEEPMNTNKKMQKLQLNRETLATLDLNRLAAVRGGVDGGTDDGGGDGAAAGVSYAIICSMGNSCIYCPTK